MKHTLLTSHLFWYIERQSHNEQKSNKIQYSGKLLTVLIALRGKKKQKQQRHIRNLKTDPRQPAKP